MKTCPLCGEKYEVLVHCDYTDTPCCADCKESNIEHISDFIDEDFLP
jgi:hypothetical protein